MSLLVDKLKKDILKHKNEWYYEDKGEFGILVSNYMFVKIDKNDFDLSEIQAPPSSFPDLDHYYNICEETLCEIQDKITDSNGKRTVLKLKTVQDNIIHIDTQFTKFFSKKSRFYGVDDRNLVHIYTDDYECIGGILPIRNYKQK